MPSLFVLFNFFPLMYSVLFNVWLCYFCMVASASEFVNLSYDDVCVEGKGNAVATGVHIRFSVQ
jgi:hypothetical protein